jgi:hypothetical protein
MELAAAGFETRRDDMFRRWHIGVPSENKAEIGANQSAQYISNVEVVVSVEDLGDCQRLEGWSARPIRGVQGCWVVIGYDVQLCR